MHVLIRDQSFGFYKSMNILSNFLLYRFIRIIDFHNYYKFSEIFSPASLAENNYLQKLSYSKILYD